MIHLFRIMPFIALILLTANLNAQTSNDELLTKLIRESDNSKIATVLLNPEKYKLQIIYTQIDREGNNYPIFSSRKFNVDSKKYFYPASTVKFPTALLALEKLNIMNIPGVTKYTSLKIDSNYTSQTKVIFDSSSTTKLPSIANYLKKVFIVSDNDAQNRIYEFLGQQYTNETLMKKNFFFTKILNRLSVSLTPEQNRHTNGFTFYNMDNVLYRQLPQVNPNEYKLDFESVKLGKGYIERGELINSPKDFSYSNYFGLEDQHEMLKSVFFPETVPAERRFNLTEDDYKFLYRAMSILPRESDFPAYPDYKTYNDGYCKFFMYGDTKDSIPSNIRIFNKVGIAYGFMIDNAYIIDFDKNIEFMLSAMIYVNEDEIFNDDIYEYATIGFPFIAELGRLIYAYEVNRKRDVIPNLDKFNWSRNK
ncbi:MAG: serine hydrolase [Ignavibacteria bacterium]|nr:serine hydrolase [Ignavibacteria bacterium]